MTIITRSMNFINSCTNDLEKTKTIKNKNQREAELKLLLNKLKQDTGSIHKGIKKHSVNKSSKNVASNNVPVSKDVPVLDEINLALNNIFLDALNDLENQHSTPSIEARHIQLFN